MNALIPSKDKIVWSNVDICKIVQTPSASQWSGGNFAFGSEKFISFNGRNGLSLTTVDGEKIFVGCQNIEKLKEKLKLMQLKF